MKHDHSSRRVSPCVRESRPALEPLEPRRLLAAAITGLTLIDADTNRPIESLDYGDTIDLAAVGRHLSIRADAVDAESVRFNYDGNPDHRIDNAAPYAIAGDRRLGRDLLPWTPTPGTHTLIVTPYAADDAAGAPGQSRIVLFNVIDSRATGRNYAPPARGSAVRKPTRPAPALPTVPAPLYVNAGGGTFTDSLGRTFRADTNFTGGFTGNSTPDVANTTDDALYQSYRAGSSFTFTHPVANGNYSLWLHFAEPTTTQPGQRTFDVTAEGALVLATYDVFAEAGGANTATAEAIDVSITDNRLDLNLAGTTGDAILSAITLVPIDVPEEMKPYSSLCESEVTKHMRSQANLRQIGVGSHMYAQDHKGNFPPDLGSLVTYMGMTAAANPRSPLSLPRGELTLIEQRAWVQGHWPGRRNDYIYLGAGKRTRDLGPDDVLAYENPDRVAGDVNVVFGDAHVERLTRQAAADLIGFPNVPPSDPPPAPEPSSPACERDADVIGSAANLRAIAQALAAYANDNRGSYPREPGTVLAAEKMDPSTFVNPRGDTLLPPDDLTAEERIAWVNAATDYVYLAGRMHSGTPATFVLAYENPAGMKDGINILFNDGHVEFREMRWAIETLRRSGVPGVA